MAEPLKKNTGILSLPVLVGALGYFVDIYDLLLFGIVRVKSLTALGLKGEELVSYGSQIVSWQMYGLLIGGLLWGILGDKRGRLNVLFGSIILYSIGNIASGFVQNVDQYMWLRLITGIGLAGELGASVTLVSEILSKEKRGIGTSVVAGVGLLGAVLAYFISKMFDWRTCYFIGGALGFGLLILRVNVLESGMFHAVKQSKIVRGNFFMFFNNWQRFVTYVKCILIGVPIWYAIGILSFFSDKFAKEMGVIEKIEPGRAIMFCYIGLALGDISIGFLSSYLKSRKKALLMYASVTILFIIAFFNQQGLGGTTTVVYSICLGLGFGSGYWALFTLNAAEQFGTNLRATSTTTVPNIVRGLLSVMLLLHTHFQSHFGLKYVQSGMLLGGYRSSLSHSRHLFYEGNLWERPQLYGGITSNTFLLFFANAKGANSFTPFAKNELATRLITSNGSSACFFSIR